LENQPAKAGPFVIWKTSRRTLLVIPAQAGIQ